MSQTKASRISKRQLGQFLTPPPLAEQLVGELPLFTLSDTVLEPSMGDGSFLLPLIDRFMPLYTGTPQERLAQVLTQNVFGIEIDPALYQQCLAAIEARWGELPYRHNLVCADFFQHWFCDPTWVGETRVRETGLSLFDIHRKFDYIVGNPPFGGTIAPAIQDQLDKQFGFRDGLKIKKETYSFFIVKSLELLKAQGHLRFICSDTFLTINTMRGLRLLLMNQGAASVTALTEFSAETKHPMVVLDFVKSGKAQTVCINRQELRREAIELTGNCSWQVTEDLAWYFSGPKIGDFLLATSGMTTGANELFVRPIVNDKIVEPYIFEFFDDSIILENQIARARLGIISPRQIEVIKQQERNGVTRRNIRVTRRATPLEISLPHPDYRFYNKAAKGRLYTPPTHAIFWKDEGDAVLTFKKNGNWYLHGVGGGKHFGRRGMTWQLIAQSLNARYLPDGYILDSGAPCAFVRAGIPDEELFFILGWTFSPLCQRLLKEVINHTKNIQGKDFERLPYPFWISDARRQELASAVRDLVNEAVSGQNNPELDFHLRSVADAYTPKA